MLVRPRVGGGADVRGVLPGDLVGLGESCAIIAADAASTWTAAAIAAGIITRTGTGGGAGFTDTTDTAANIIAALAGNQPGDNMVPGTSFRLLVENLVAQALTFAAGTGVIAGALGSNVLNIAASCWREYLVTLLNDTPVQTLSCATTNASKVVTFQLQPGQTYVPVAVSGSPGASITPGATVSGTGITAGTRVASVDWGVGGITGVHLDTNATATTAAGAYVALTFGPTIRFDGLRGGITL